MRVGEAIEYLRRLDPREPIFILRGQDKLAPRSIMTWIEKAEQEKVHPQKIEGAVDCLGAFLLWHKKKLPD